MPHTTVPLLADSVAIQSGAVVSKVIHRDEDLNVTVFGFDAGEGLSEHSTSRPAIVQVLSGRLTFTVEGDAVDMGPGSWLHMSAGSNHSLDAHEPTVMLLTMVKPDK